MSYKMYKNPADAADKKYPPSVRAALYTAFYDQCLLYL